MPLDPTTEQAPATMGDQMPFVVISSDEEDEGDNQLCRVLVLRFDVLTGGDKYGFGGGWAKLLPRLVGKIADGVLRSYDVTEYIRLRAVCSPWRAATADPSRLESRFFPRRWLMQPESCLGEKVAGVKTSRRTRPPPTMTYRFRNVLTGATLQIPMPDDADMCTHHGSAEGLLVIHHSLSDTLCLLNPLTQACIELPYVNTMYCDETKDTSFLAGDITAVGVIVGEHSPQPTVVVSVTYGQQSAIFHGKPGELVWGTVDVSSCVPRAREGRQRQEGEEGDETAALPAFKGGLAVNGRFFVPTPAGDVLAVELRPLPRLVYIAKQAGDHRCRPSAGVSSYLVPAVGVCGGNDGVLLARMHTSGDGSPVGCILFVLHVGSRSFTVVSVRGMTVLLPSTTLRSSSFPALGEGIFTEEQVAEIFRRNLI